VEKQSDIYFLKLLQDAINSLNTLDELIETNGRRQSEVDSELCDLLHLVENNDLNDDACIKIMARIKELRKVRRSLRNEYELINRYQEIKARLSSKENRQFIFVEIQKRFKTLNQEYKNRILTDKQVEDLLEKQGVIEESKEKISRKISEKSQQINIKIKELLEKGYSQTEIAKEMNMTQPSISIRIKKIKESEQ